MVALENTANAGETDCNVPSAAFMPIFARWYQTTSAQRFSLSRVCNTSRTIFSGMAAGLMCGRDDSVGISQRQAASRKLEMPLGLETSREGRFTFSRRTCLLSLFHFCFQRQTVLRCTPHFLATTVTGSRSITSSRIAIALAFGRLGLVEYLRYTPASPQKR